MAKLVLADVASTGVDLQTLITTFNDNMTLIETAIENTLSRDGTTPNFMDHDLDMNGNCLINVGCLEYVAGGIDNLTYLNQCNQYQKGAATEMFSATINGGVYTPIQCNSNVHYIVLDQDLTMGAPTGPTNGLSGQVINFIFKQDGTGGWTVAWNSVYHFPSGTIPTITAAAGSVDIVTAQYDSVNSVWYCACVQDFQAQP